MPDLYPPIRTLKLEGPGFVAANYTANMKELTWLRLRQSGIGGYDFGLLAFPDDNGGPLSLYFSKLTPITSVNEGNDYTDFGNDLQDVMARRTLPRKLMKLGLAPDQFRVYSSPWFYRSTVNPWHVMNIDGVIEFFVDWTYVDEAGNEFPIAAGRYVLELKTADLSQREKWKDGATPDRYWGQAQHYPIGLGMPGTLMFCLLNRTPLLRYIPVDEPFRKHHHEVCSEFWGRVERRDPPMAFGGDADLQAVRKLYPVGGETAKVVEGIHGEVIDYLAAKKQLKDAEARVKMMDAKFKSQIGDASGLVDTMDSGIAWTRWTNKKFDAQALRLAYPALYERFKTKEEPGNRLTAKVKGVVSDE